MSPSRFEYHISLHHSQTTVEHIDKILGLNTIYLYIILKRSVGI